ncbi:MAG: WXG100 family type VII secretion target [Mycolicibacterium sp.]|uniref:WXG100 family type VII secretion target n=1 Tax=Mycolicibacterium sp. TaxID=2320850 RepID=UPI003D100372
MDQIQHNFGAIENELAAMQGQIRLGVGVTEELSQELNTWAGFWHGAAHEEATSFVNRVHMTLTHVLDAAQDYTNKANMANMDMQQQEMSNTAMWGA